MKSGNFISMLRASVFYSVDSAWAKVESKDSKVESKDWGKPDKTSASSSVSTVDY